MQRDAYVFLALIQVIMQDMNISYTASGLLITVTSIMTGTSMFFGNTLIDHLGATKTLKLSFISLIVSSLMTKLCIGYTLVFTARVICAIGEGLAMVGIPALVATMV